MTEPEPEYKWRRYAVTLGKARMTPLVKLMIEKGYVVVRDDDDK